MAVRKAGSKAESRGYKDLVKATKPKVSAVKSPVKPKTVASKSAINNGALKPAAISGGAKFGGVHKRSGNRLHRIGQAEYRNKPFFKNPKLLTPPKITLEQAYRNTTLPEIRTSKFVELVSIQPGKLTFKKGPLKGFKVYRARTYTTINRHRHEVLMMYEPDEDGNLRRDSRFIFSCSCPFLKYTLEYSNAKLGLSFIYYSNGQPPVITNPRLRFSLCKHSIVACRHLLRKARAPRKGTPPPTAKRPATARKVARK